MQIKFIKLYSISVYLKHYQVQNHLTFAPIPVHSQFARFKPVLFKLGCKHPLLLYLNFDSFGVDVAPRPVT